VTLASDPKTTSKGVVMKKVGLALVLVAAVTLVLGAAGTSSAHRKPPAQPDTYVTTWDTVGSQAFTAAALSPRRLLQPAETPT